MDEILSTMFFSFHSHNKKNCRKKFPQNINSPSKKKKMEQNNEKKGSGNYQKKKCITVIAKKMLLENERASSFSGTVEAAGLKMQAVS